MSELETGMTAQEIELLCEHVSWTAQLAISSIAFLRAENLDEYRSLRDEMATRILKSFSADDTSLVTRAELVQMLHDVGALLVEETRRMGAVQ